MFVLVQEGSEKYALANESSKISLIDKAKSFFDKIMKEIAKIGDLLKNLTSQFNLKAATGFLIDKLSSQTPTVTKENNNSQLVFNQGIDQEELVIIPTPSPKPLASLAPLTLSISSSPSPTPSRSPSPSPSITPSPSPSLIKCEKLHRNLPPNN